MTTSLSVSAARAALPEILDRVAKGEEVSLTRHGRVVAIVVRPEALRMRRGEGAIAAAVAIRDRLKEARRASRPSAKGALDRKRTSALLADLRASRTRRR